MKATNQINWSKRFEKCTSCDTVLFEHKGNGLCSRCYSVSKEIEKLNAASGQVLEILIYKFIPVRDVINVKSESIAKQKEIIKKHIISKRLYYLKLYGQIKNDSLAVDIVRLEDIFNEIGRRVTKQTRFYTNGLSRLKEWFTEEQRKIIALKLLLMLINKRKFIQK